MIQEDLPALFQECLTIPYRNVENCGSYAFTCCDGHLKLFFEKSHGRVDWKNNLDFPCKAYRHMDSMWFCHRGFLKVWRSMEPYLAPLVQQRNIRRITIVGYSHGAAIAALCHEYVWYHRPDLRDHLVGYGFGCPRIYWGFYMPASFQQRWATFYPIRHGCDLVTHLPPAVLGFRHVHSVRKIGRWTDASPIDAHRPAQYLIALLCNQVANL